MRGEAGTTRLRAATAHPTLPRGEHLAAGAVGSLEEILVGPARGEGGATNLFGALRTTLAACGYASVREFHKAEIVVAPGRGRAGAHPRSART